MMFKLSNTLLAATVALFAMAGGVSAAARRDIALADNPGLSSSSLSNSLPQLMLPSVDACNGSNHYGVGHSCAFSTPIP
ncbi:hypothetical protein PENSPDRAFT_646043 [Peniophora sp. CONT]|nr:hypothetical protein PENSPDRAFT_646043 [Peniophora sp. CONT]